MMDYNLYYYLYVIIQRNGIDTQNWWFDISHHSLVTQKGDTKASVGIMVRVPLKLDESLSNPEWKVKQAAAFKYSRQCSEHSSSIT